MPTMNVEPDSDLELQAIADALGKARKIVVVTGAGISTNCGIPDFRSENGLYSLIQAQYDAALQNPPWEETNKLDIDDRPTKKRRKWFYEVVNNADDTVVGTIDPDLEETPNRAESVCTNPRRQSSQRLARASITRSASSRSTSFGSSSRSDASKESTPATSKESTPPSAAKSPKSRAASASGTPEPENSDLAAAPNLSQESKNLAIAAVPKSASADQEAPSLSQSTRELPNLKGRDLFDSMIWKDRFTTSIFYMFITSLRKQIQNITATTPTHQFLLALRDGGRLVRNYSQNIDGLEERVGLTMDLSMGTGNRTRFHSKIQREPRPGRPSSDSPHFGGVEVVQLHGGLSFLRCDICSRLSAWTEDDCEANTSSGMAPECTECRKSHVDRTGRGRRGLAVGRLRPDIVLYGEEHPQANLISPLITHDLSLGPDVLLIMGTSLRVHGLKVMIKEFAKAVHAKRGKVIFVNRTKPSESAWGDFIDYWIGWDCDEWVSDLRERRACLWLPQGTMEDLKPRKESKAGLDVSTNDSRKQYRPGAIRPDRMSGAYHTFKILDALAKLQDPEGKQLCSRAVYWPPLINRKSLVKEATEEHTKAKRLNRQSLPAEKPAPAKANTSKKRKSYPSAVSEDPNKAVIEASWERLRKLAPGLPLKAPIIDGRFPLQELQKSIHLNFHLEANSRPSDEKNNLPVICGLTTPRLPDIRTHPPGGMHIQPAYLKAASSPMTPKSRSQMQQGSDRQKAPYNTTSQASHSPSLQRTPAESESTIVVLPRNTVHSQPLSRFPTSLDTPVSKDAKSEEVPGGSGCSIVVEIPCISRTPITPPQKRVSIDSLLSSSPAEAANSSAEAQILLEATEYQQAV